MCVSLELSLDRNINLMALRLQYYLIFERLLYFLHIVMIEENPLADCAHTCT